MGDTREKLTDLKSSSQGPQLPFQTSTSTPVIDGPSSSASGGTPTADGQDGYKMGQSEEGRVRVGTVFSSGAV